MRAATEGSRPPVMPQGNLVEVLSREVRQGSPGELMVESSAFRQRRPQRKTNKGMSDEAADTAALTYLPYSFARTPSLAGPGQRPSSPSSLVPRALVAVFAVCPGCSSPRGHLCVSASLPGRSRPVARTTPVPDVPVRALGDPSLPLCPAPGNPPPALFPLGLTLPPLHLLFPPVLIPAGLSSACVPSGAPCARLPLVPPHLALPRTAVAASLAAAALPSW